MDNKKIASFTGLRFIMIMIIVFSHFDFIAVSDSFNSFFKDNLFNTIFAVDFFFLLSGFGMMFGSLARVEDKDLKFPGFKNCIKYGFKHIRKIFPVYIGTILFCFLWKIADSFFAHSFSIIFLCKKILQLLVNFTLLQSATGMMAFTHAFNGVTWFLSALFCIYLVSPIAIYILRKISKSYMSDAALFVLNLFFIITSAIVFRKIESAASAIEYLAYASPYSRLFYVLIGMNLAMIFSRLKADNIEPSKFAMDFLEIIVTLGGCAYSFTRVYFPAGVGKTIADLLICSSFILIFAFDKGVLSDALRKPEFQKLGNMAMYIFLIHYPLRVYLGDVVEKVWGWNPVTSICFMIFILVITFVISEAIYKHEHKEVQ